MTPLLLPQGGRGIACSISLSSIGKGGKGGRTGLDIVATCRRGRHFMVTSGGKGGGRGGGKREYTSNESDSSRLLYEPERGRGGGGRGHGLRFLKNHSCSTAVVNT